MSVGALGEEPAHEEPRIDATTTKRVARREGMPLVLQAVCCAYVRNSRIFTGLPAAADHNSAPADHECEKLVTTRARSSGVV